MKPPAFLKVSPADIGRVGFDGAAILALVRYVTELPGENNGRMTVDGKNWWRATHADIGQALGGVHRKSVGRVLLKLEDAGEILAIPAETFYGDRAQAYRAPDLPLDGSGQGSDLPLDESGPPSGQIRPSTWDESGQGPGTDPANLPSVGELEEGGRSAGTAADEPEPVEHHQSSNDPLPQQSENGQQRYFRARNGEPACHLHRNFEQPPKCGGCKAARIASEQDAVADQAQQDRAKAEIRSAIDGCPDCDDFGRDDDLNDCPRHENFRTASRRGGAA